MPISRNAGRRALGALYASVIVVACRSDNIDAAAAGVPTATALPPATSVPTPTATPPALTPRPVVVLAVSPQWSSGAAAAVSLLDESGTLRAWQIAVDGDPAAQLATGSADVALVAGSEGVLVRQEPLALAVPFTTEWESVTLAEAHALLGDGHPLVIATAWADMPPTHKALRVDGLLPDDPTYPFHVTWSLMAAPGQEAAAAELAPALQAAAPPDPVVHVAAVGDIMLDRDLGEAILRGDLGYPFAHVSELLSSADLAVGNLESALGDVGQPADKRYTFRAPPQAAESLALAGFDLLSLANNHALDYGPDALLQGIALLDAQGVATVGGGASDLAARAPYVRTVNGLRLAFLAYVDVPLEESGFDAAGWTATAARPGVAWATPRRMREDIAAASAGADVVIVLLHSGTEFQATPDGPQATAARTAIDAGADLVIGHHTHVMQGVEFRGQGAIVYGLGDFAFASDGGAEAALLNVWLDKDGVRQLELIPVMLPIRGQPRLATPEEAFAIRQRVYLLTARLN